MTAREKFNRIAHRQAIERMKRDRPKKPHPVVRAPIVREGTELTITEICQKYHRCPSGITCATSSGRLPSRKVGTSRLVLEADFLKFLEQAKENKRAAGRHMFEARQAKREAKKKGGRRQGMTPAELLYAGEKCSGLKSE